MIITSKFSKQKWYSALVKKTDFDDKPKNLNKKDNSNKTKHVLVKMNWMNCRKMFNYYQQKIIIFSYVEIILHAIMGLKTRLFINQHLIL